MSASSPARGSPARSLRLAFLAGLLALPLAAPAAAQQEDAASRGSWKAAAYYVPNRVLDLLDVFKLNVSVGPGSGFDVRLTRLFEVGFSEYDVLRIGLNGRRFPVYREKLSEASLTLLGLTSGQRTRDGYEAGATLQFLVVGVEAAVNVRSILDFLAGIVLLDIEDDDWGREEQR